MKRPRDSRKRKHEDEEPSPKRAKALKDANKTGILDKCVFCTKSGVSTILDETATNMRFLFHLLIYSPKITV